MKKAALLLCILLTLCTFAPALCEDAPVLTVQGSASVVLDADHAVLSLGVETEDADVEKALKENAAAMDQVLSALREAGCGDGDLRTCNFNLYSTLRYETAPDGGERTAVLYHVSNTLEVTVHGPDSAGALIDLAIAAGVNRMDGLSFRSARTGEAYLQALTEACADARARADTLCAALGLEITGIRTVRLPESSSAFSRNVLLAEGASADGKAASTVLPGGDLTVSASVEIEFDVR